MMASTRRAALLAGWLAALATGAGAQTAGLAPLAPALRDPAGIASRLAILLEPPMGPPAMGGALGPGVLARRRMPRTALHPRHRA